MSDPNRKAEKAALAASREAQHQQEIAGLEFQEWPKIARLNRDVVITEKIDGTNAAVGISLSLREWRDLHADEVMVGESTYRVYAQSRTRIITPGNDNAGFAAWVRKNAEALVRTLGEGLHFGEWWGCSIARNYGLSERRFSLFNTKKWGEGEGAAALESARALGVAVYSVPVLYAGPWTGCFGYKDAESGEWLRLDAEQEWPAVEGQQNPRPRYAPNFILEWLQRVGSQAAPGFMKPEGICVFHQASGTVFKATCEHDDEWKGKRA